MRLQFSLTLLLLAGGQAAGDVIELRSDPWCPYVCDDPERPGFMIEIAQEALALHGHEVHYESIPWSRAIRQAEQGQIHGIVGATQSEAPNLLFSDPVAEYVDALAFRIGETVAVKTSEDLEGHRLGVINDYEYYGAVNDYIAAHGENPLIIQYATGVDPLTANLRKLLAGRVDVVAETESVLRYAVQELQIEDQLSIYVPDLGPGGPGEVHLAFAADYAGYVSAFNDGMAQLRASGRLDEILARYGL